MLANKSFSEAVVQQARTPAHLDAVPNTERSGVNTQSLYAIRIEQIGAYDAR